MAIIAKAGELYLFETDENKGLGYVLNVVTGSQTEEKKILSLISLSDSWEDVDNQEALEKDIYGFIDETLKKAGVVIGGKQPWGAKQIGKMIELRLYRGLKKSVELLLNSLTGKELKVDVINGVNDVIKGWVATNWVAIESAFEELFKKGFAAGAIDQGFQIEDKHAMGLLKNGKYRIGSRIKLFADDAVKQFADIIEHSYTPEGTFSLDSLTQKMGEAVQAQRYELERIARTETSQVSNTGRLWAWDNDPDKYSYQYVWNSTPDKRRRKMKEIRSSGNPYSLDEIKFLWLHNEQQLPSGKWENGNINCRCSLSRTPVSTELTGNRFDLQSNKFRQTLEMSF